MLFKKMLYVSLAIIFTLSLSACSDDENTTAPTPTAKANVLVVHASPDAPGVDLLVDNTVAGTNLTFPNNTGYLSVNAGTRNIKVNVTGTSTTVIQANLNLMENKNYSVFAVNQVSAIEPLVLEDNLSSPASGKAHVRFIHLSPNAPAVNITLTDGTVVFNNVPFKGSVDFTPLNAGTYNLQVRDAATNQTVVLELPNITLQTGKIYTVFAKGFLGGTGAQQLGAQIIVNK
ncbi:MAG: DUF4397 domain-containing protein [Ignavibacterium sp.]